MPTSRTINNKALTSNITLTAADIGALPTVIPSAIASATAGITIADHSTTTITGVQSSTTSVTGVQATTTTASYVKSGGNGTAPSLGTAFSIPNVTSAADITVPIKNTSATTVPIKNTSATTVPIKDTAATTVPIKGATVTIPNVTSTGSATYAQGAFNGGSLTMTMGTGANAETLYINFASATHSPDTLTYTPPAFGDSFTITGVQSSTTSVIGVQSSTTSVTGVQANTTTVTGVQASTTTASKVTLGTAFSVPNGTSVGSASN